MDESTLSLRYAALSDVGRVRKDNQDSGYASANLLVIADGVGGAAYGDVASATAVNILRRLDEPPGGDPLEALAGAVHRVHDRLGEMVEHDPELDGTSTTITAALFDGERLGVAHAGDSRGYLMHDGELARITKDHTFVQSLIDEGRITEEESRTHPHRNLILRAVDGVHETDPDLFYVDLSPGDRILLCSDGASGSLDDGRLADILSTGSIDYAVVELVRAALAAGSSDNVTCVVADVVAEAPEETAEPILVGAVAAPLRRPPSRSLFRGHRGGDTGEIEPIPGEDEDPEEQRYAPRPPRRYTGARRIAAVLLVLALIAAGCLLAYRWTQKQYYVAADQNRVTIFKGVPANVPVVRLHSVQHRTDITIESLPQYFAQQVRAGYDADNLADAQSIVRRLTGLVRVCPTPTPSPSASPTKKPTSSSSSRPRHRASRTASPSPSPSPSPSASPTLSPPDCVEAPSS